MKHVFCGFVFTLIAVCLSLPVLAAPVQEVTSASGFKAWLVEEHGLPLVAVKIVFRDSGSAYDPAGKEGTVALAAAMLMEGAGDLDSNAFNVALENNAIQLNFGVDDDSFRASVESLSEYKEKAFSYISMALTNARFDDSALDRVRSQTLSVLSQQEHEPAYIVRREWEKTAFGGHPYSNQALGTTQSVATITKAEMQNFVRRHLTRENMLISVVGDITPAELGRLMDAHLGSLPAKYAPEIKIQDTRLPSEAKQIVIDNDIPQTMVLFGANALRREDPEYYAAYVMNEMLGGGGALNSKLGLEIREKRGLAYSVYTQVSPMAHSAYWRGGFATRNEKVGEALAVLRSVLKEFSDKGPTDAELADAKDHLIGGFVLGLDSNGDIASYLTSMQLYHLGRDYLDKRNQYIAAVTKDQVKAVAKKLVNPDTMIVTMVGKPNLKTVADKAPAQ